MSDIFESDIESENDNLSTLEDSDINVAESENIVFDYPLYHIKLDYSCETVYAKTPDNKRIFKRLFPFFIMYHPLSVMNLSNPNKFY